MKEKEHELNHKEATIKKKEEVITEMKKDTERLNQQLISKDMEN